ncbi:acyltransferase [Capnocytophaga canis]|uniref:acyltransferase family protein n=1 Tax=Capnocytophaga canis TaxID=1848903 RepID=UPI001ACB00A4|nr:acyltransferase [Capnocytophaga canis]GIM61834.1 acyltransferase [Capnocytophaga canis]
MKAESKQMGDRLYGLDYLRGLAAFGIMIYHYCYWQFGSFGSETFLGKVGVYGVSVFYILSGLTLYYVYQDKFELSKQWLVLFFKKRIFRIFPLLYVVNTIALLGEYILNSSFPPFETIFLNYTGLFGFIAWDNYLSTGAWSIGNELVFYTFFPFFMYFAKKNKKLLWSTIILSLFVYIYFAFVVLDDKVGLSDQWRNYVNPLNQVFLFLSGFVIGCFLTKKQLNKKMTSVLLILGIFIFIFYPIFGDTINLVTNFERIIFTLIGIVICWVFYKNTIQLPNILHKPLKVLGEMCYSLYLLHPIVWFGYGFVFRQNKLNYSGGGNLLIIR